MHGNDGVSSVMRKRSRSAYTFELPCSCRSPADTWLRGSSLTSTPFGAPVGWWTSRSRWWSWYDRCKGAEEAESSSGLSSTAARVRAQRVPRGWGGPGLHEPRTGHPAHPAPLLRNPAGNLAKPHPQTQLQRPHRHCSHPRTHHLCQSRHANFHTHTFTCGFFAVFDPKCKRSVVA